MPAVDGDGAQPGGVDERIAQLQHALTSRIVIEQAKGILAERYSLSPGEAYELIRLAARSNGIKAHSLSTKVVESPRRTPVEILVLLGDGDGDGHVSSRRAIANVFRQINESLLKLDRPDGAASFVCECADPSCTERIEWTAASMQRLSGEKDVYLVARPHVDPAFEQIIASEDGLVIVRRSPVQNA